MKYSLLAAFVCGHSKSACPIGVFYLLVLASVVISSPVRPSDDRATIQTHIDSSEGWSSASDDAVSKTTTLHATAPTGSVGPPDLHVTSEVRTMSLRIAEGGVPMMKHIIHPIIFGTQSQPEEVFMEPTEVEAPDATPTASSLVTSVASKVVFVSPSAASENDGKGPQQPVSTQANNYHIDGSPQNITIISNESQQPQIIPIIKITSSPKDTSGAPRNESDEATVEKDTPSKSIETVESYNSDPDVDVPRSKRIFPSVSNSSVTEPSSGSHSPDPQLDSQTASPIVTTDAPKLNETLVKLNETTRTETEKTTKETRQHKQDNLVTSHTSKSPPLVLPSQDNVPQNDSSLSAIYLANARVSDASKGPLKLEPRQANAASYYEAEDPLDENKSINDKVPSTSGESLNQASVKQEPPTNRTSSTPANQTNQQSTVNIPFGEPIYVGRDNSDLSRTSLNVSEQEVTSSHGQSSESVLGSGPTSGISKSKSNQTFHISAVKERHELPRRTRLEESKSPYAPSERIAEDVPAGNAHLIPGVLNSRSLKPILDSYDPDPSSSSPLQQVSSPVSEQIDNSSGAGCVIAISLGVLALVIGAIIGFGVVVYHRQTGIRPKVLSDRSCANSDSGGYFDDQCRVAYVNSQLDVPKGTPEDLVSLDNDSFLNSLESMTIQNLWTDSIRHTKL